MIKNSKLEILSSKQIQSPIKSGTNVQNPFVLNQVQDLSFGIVSNFVLRILKFRIHLSAGIFE